MNKLCVAILVLAFSLPYAFASDSQWALCKSQTVLFEKNNSLVLNMFERRNNKGDGRATDFTMLFGSWDLKGSVDTTSNSSPKVLLKGPSSSFKGIISILDGADSFNLKVKGTLKLSSQVTNVDSEFTCEILNH